MVEGAEAEEARRRAVEIASLADTTLVLLAPGMGDAIQAVKAGVLEVADVFVINKADRAGVEETRRDLELMLELSELGAWRPPILTTVAARREGVDERRLRQTVRVLGTLLGELGREFLGPVGRGHDVAADRLRQGAQQGRDELVAHAGHLPVEAVGAQLRQ